MVQKPVMWQCIWLESVKNLEGFPGFHVLRALRSPQIRIEHTSDPIILETGMCSEIFGSLVTVAKANILYRECRKSLLKKHTPHKAF